MPPETSPGSLESSRTARPVEGPSRPASATPACSPRPRTLHMDSLRPESTSPPARGLRWWRVAGRRGRRPLGGQHHFGAARRHRPEGCPPRGAGGLCCAPVRRGEAAGCGNENGRTHHSHSPGETQMGLAVRTRDTQGVAVQMPCDASLAGDDEAANGCAYLTVEMRTEQHCVPPEPLSALS